jgi:putative ABC transport system permease protein
MMLANYEYFDEARLGLKGTVQMFYILMEDAKHGAKVAKAVDDLFANSSAETRTEPIREFAQSSLQSLGDMGFVVRAVVSAALFALCFSTSAMLMQSFLERTPELAILKTIGFSGGVVLALITGEAVILCLAAAALGLVIAMGLFPLSEELTQMALDLPFSVIVHGLVIALALAITSAALPAWRAWRLQIADALTQR